MKMLFKILTFPFRLVAVIVLIFVSAILVMLAFVFVVLYAITSLIISKLVFVFALALISCVGITIYVNLQDGGSILESIPIAVVGVALLMLSMFATVLLEKIYMLLLNAAAGVWFGIAKIMTA